MEPGETGVLVNRVIPGGSAAGRLRDGDVILSLDGKPVANDGTVEIDGDRWPLSVYVSLKPPGETLRVGVLRPPGSQPGAPGGERRTTVTLHPAPTRHRIPRHNQYDSLPRYVVYGGIVFQPLTREYLKLWDRWWEEADRRLAYYWTYGPEDRPHPAREELVLINTVLPDRATSVHAGVMDEVVDSINGIRIDSLDDVLPALRAPLRGFVVIEFDSGRCPLVVRADALEEAHGRIMERYGIPREGAR